MRSVSPLQEMLFPSFCNVPMVPGGQVPGCAVLIDSGFYKTPCKPPSSLWNPKRNPNFKSGPGWNQREFHNEVGVGIPPFIIGEVMSSPSSWRGPPSITQLCFTSDGQAPFLLRSPPESSHFPMKGERRQAKLSHPFPQS